MATNYKPKTDTQTGVTSDTAGTEFDFRGHSKCYVQLDCIDFSGTPDVIIQTSNDKSNWVDLTTIELTTDQAYYASEFGRYLRCYADLTTDETIDYIAYYEAKE